MNSTESTHDIELLLNALLAFGAAAIACLVTAGIAASFLRRHGYRWTQPLVVWVPGVLLALIPIGLLADLAGDQFVPPVLAMAMSLLLFCLVTSGLKLARDGVETKKSHSAAKAVRNSTDSLQRFYRDWKVVDAYRETVDLRMPFIGEDRDTGKVVRANLLGVTHGLVPGGSGMGKSHFLTIVARICAAAGRAVIIVDPKGDLAFADKSRRLAGALRRDFQFYSLTPTGDEKLDEHRRVFQILGYGNPSEAADTFLNSMEFESPHFKAIVEYGLSLVCSALKSSGERPNLRRAQELLNDPRQLATMLVGLTDSMETSGRTGESEYATFKSGIRFLDQLSSDQASGLQGAATRCATLADSQAGPSMLPGDLPNLDFVGGIKSGSIIHVSIDSQAYPNLAPQVVAFFLSALSAAGGQLMREGWNGKACAMIDEMGAFTGTQGKNLLERSRSAGISTWWSPQSLISIRDTVGPEMVEALIDNCDFIGCFRQQSPESAELLAQVAGTEEGPESTRQEEAMLGKFFSRFTGMSSVRQADHFIVHPNEFKHLRKGEMAMIDKTNGKRVMIVRVRGEIQIWQLEMGK